MTNLKDFFYSMAVTVAAVAIPAVPMAIVLVWADGLVK